MTDGAGKGAEKQRGRPWPKGVSGNPAGYRKGSRHKVTLLAEKLMEGDAEDVVKTIIAAAKNGDMTAARIVVERILPPRKDRPITFDLPPITNSSDAAGAMSGLLQAVAAGEVTPEEAGSVSKLIEGFLKAQELSEIEKRLAALEALEAEE